MDRLRRDGVASATAKVLLPSRVGLLELPALSRGQRTLVVHRCASCVNPATRYDAVPQRTSSADRCRSGIDGRDGRVG